MAIAVREPTYLILDEKEDFTMDATVEADGYQRIMVTGYLERHKADGVYRTPIVPQMFFGADGQQLTTWRQYLKKGNYVVLSRDSGNPVVLEKDLSWRKVSNSAPTPKVGNGRVIQHVVLEEEQPFPFVPVAVAVAIPLSLFLLYKILK